MEERRLEAEGLIKKVIQEKSLIILSEEEKAFLIDFYNDDMKDACRDYKGYLELAESQKIMNIIILVLKEYLGSWHISSNEVQEISACLEAISKMQK